MMLSASRRHVPDVAMRILIVGGGVQYGVPKSYFRSFKEIGEDVFFFDDERFFWRGWKLFDRILNNHFSHKIFWRFFSRKAERGLFNYVKKERPDLLFVFKGVLFSGGFPRVLKRECPNLILFYFSPDDLLNPLNTNRHMKRGIKEYDCVFTPRKFALDEILAMGVKRAEYLPFAFDPLISHPIDVSKEDRRRFGSDVVFVGTYEKERLVILEGLGVYDLAIWGNAWNKISRFSPIRKSVRFQEVVGDGILKVFGSSKVVLGFLRKKNRDTHTMRTFEIPASGAFMLHERTDEALSFFEEGKEADYFSTLEELKEKINFYLKNDEKRKNVAIAGHKRAISSGYSYFDRAKRVLKVYNEIKQKS